VPNETRLLAVALREHRDSVHTINGVRVGFGHGRRCSARRCRTTWLADIRRGVIIANRISEALVAGETESQPRIATTTRIGRSVTGRPA